VINALSNVTQIKVLSAPQLMVLDNEPARLQVGSLVPVLTQSSKSTLSANAPIVNSVDYRIPCHHAGDATGQLRRPRDSGHLARGQRCRYLTTGNIDSPTFNQRLIRTRVAVQDGQTVGMAA